MDTAQNNLNQTLPGRCAGAVHQRRKPDDHLSWPDLRALSRYPHDYEELVSLPDIGSFKVRPIRSTDAGLLKALFQTLSPRSIYMRFFSPLKQLNDEMVTRLTKIDYDKEVALTAIQTRQRQAQMLAFAQVIETLDSQHGEFAVLVSDPLQGKGLGACLLLRCMGIATQRGMKHLCGLVLAENTQMLALGRKLNFAVTRIPQSAEYELTIALPAGL